MNPAADFARPIDDLLSKMLDGRLDDREQEALAALLRSDPQARRLYHDHIALHALFHWKESGGRPGAREDVEAGADDFAPGRLTAAPLSAPLSLNAAWHGMAGYVASHNFATSYLIAAVVLGLAMLTSSLVYVTHPAHLVKAGPASDTTQEEQIVFVGRITGMKDCRWADPDTQTYLGASVPLGRRYALSAGLMEITYNTGAKVILEGPCTYQVESRAAAIWPWAN